MDNRQNGGGFLWHRGNTCTCGRIDKSPHLPGCSCKLSIHCSGHRHFPPDWLLHHPVDSVNSHRLIGGLPRIRPLDSVDSVALLWPQCSKKCPGKRREEAEAKGRLLKRRKCSLLPLVLRTNQTCSGWKMRYCLLLHFQCCSRHYYTAFPAIDWPAAHVDGPAAR